MAAAIRRRTVDIEGDEQPGYGLAGVGGPIDLVRPGHRRSTPAQQSGTWEPLVQILSPRPFR
jgi:hypothetical protein